MIRFLLLIGYMGLMMYLQVSGTLNQYINVHYNYLATLSMVLAFVMAIAQLILWNKADPQKHPTDHQAPHHHHEHDGHNHGLTSPYQK